MGSWVPTRDGKTRCVRHGVDFALPDTCTKCISDPGEPDDVEDNELPYISGLKTDTEWEKWFAENADKIIEQAESCSTETGQAAMYGQAFKFAREARTAASVRERAYLTQKHQREIHALRSTNEQVLKLSSSMKRKREDEPKGPTREDGN